MREVIKVRQLLLQPPRSALHWLAAGLLVGAAAAVALPVQAQGRHGHGPAEGGGPGPMAMMFGGPPEHVARRVDRLLDGLNATDAQRTQIRQIATAAAADLSAQRKAGHGLREQALQAFTAPTVDAGAAESVRQQMSAQQDQASKRTLQAMLDVARVLTPEQRATLGSRMKERQAAMNDRMQRMQRGDQPRERPAREPGKP
jgi:periplasmic protein CpxP/Spy